MKRVLALMFLIAFTVLLVACSLSGFTEEDVLSGKAYSLYYTPLTEEESGTIGEKCCFIMGFRNCNDCFMENIGDGIYGDLTILEARFKGDGSNVIIPEEIEGMKVVGINGGSFNGCYSICSVEIPDTILHIDSNTFRGCNIDLILIGSVGSVADSFSKEDCITFNNENRTNTTNSHKLFFVNEAEGVRIIGYQNKDYNTVTEKAKQKYESQGLKIESIQLLGDGQCMIVPKKINGKEVYAIASGAFIPSNSFYSITIPASVQKIDDGAFVETDDGTHFSTLIVSNSDSVKTYAEKMDLNI